MKETNRHATGRKRKTYEKHISFNRHFIKEIYELPRRHEKMLNIILIRKIQIKATERYHYAFIRMSIIYIKW